MPSARSALVGRDDEARRVVGLVHESRRAMAEMHEQWVYDIQFFRGHQWIYQNLALGRLMPIPATPWRPRITDNQTRPLLTSMLALLIEKDPTWEAVGGTADEDDLLAAKGYASLLAREWDRLDLGEALAEAMLLALITGNAFWRVAWNPMGGRPLGVPTPQGGELALGRGDPPPEGRRPRTGNVIPFSVPGSAADEEPPPERFEGDVDVQVVPPFNVDVPLRTLSMRHAAWVAHHAHVHKDVLRDRIGSKADDIQPGDGMDEWSSYERQLRFDTGVGELSATESRDVVRVTEFWEAPSRRHRQGRVVTVAGGTALDAKDNPYGGRIPLVHFGGARAPMRFWRDGFVREIEPLQKAHNSALSRYAMIMMLSSNPKVLADKGAIGDKAVTDEPGEIVFRRRGSKVEFIPPPPPSTIHPQIMSIVTNAMQTLTGVNDTLAGQNPPNVRAALSIRFLQESGLRRFVPIAKDVELALRHAGRLMLYMHRRFWSDDRMERVVGTRAAGEVFHMRRADVDRVDDVTIRPGSLVPRSPAAQQDTIIQLLQYAPFLFQGPDGIQVEDILRTMDMPSAAGDVPVRAAQRARAYREHVAASQGQAVEAMPWDDHVLHMQIHGCRLSDDAWSAAEPQAAAALAEHYAAHAAQMMNSAPGPQAGPAAVPPGGRPGPSGPPAAGARRGPTPGPSAPAGRPMAGPPGMMEGTP